jgi:hypothetical protein
VCGQHRAPAAFNSGKDPVSIVQEAGWAPEPVWIGAENLTPPGFDPRTFQPVASRYTDYGIPAPTFNCNRVIPPPSSEKGRFEMVHYFWTGNCTEKRKYHFLQFETSYMQICREKNTSLNCHLVSTEKLRNLNETVQVECSLQGSTAAMYRL